MNIIFDHLDQESWISINKKRVLHAFQLIYLEHLEIFAITFAWQALEEIEENVPACRTVETDPECHLWWWHEMPQNSWISHHIFSFELLHFLMVEKNMYLFGCHEEDSTEKMPYNPILHYPYSSWIKKPMAKTTEYLCDLSFVKQLARGCAEILPKTLKQFSIMLKTKQYPFVCRPNVLFEDGSNTSC